MRRCRQLILTAVETEARAIARAFQLDERGLRKGVVFGEEVALGVAGIGARRLAELLSDIEPELMVMTGLAGGLAPQVRVGDVVIDAALPAFSPERFRLHQGRLHTATTIVATAAEKRALYERTGGLAVDMETAVAAAFARERGIGFLAIRAVSDAADDPLDSRLFTLVDGAGRPRAGRVAAYLLTGPWRVFGLVRVGRATRVALTNLVAVLQHFAATRWPDNRQGVGLGSASVIAPEKS
jgi:nucleoside phosphorylase